MMHKKFAYKILLLEFCLFCITVAFTGCTKKKTEIAEIINIEVWHYYRGKQKIAFDYGVNIFNETVGKEKRIAVKAVNIGNTQETARYVIDSCQGKLGVRVPPNIVMAYSDTVFVLDEMGFVVALDKYFSPAELDVFVPNFIEEGRISEDKGACIFPALKSSEIFYYNKTDWERFQKQCNIGVNDITSAEKLVEAAGVYYNWTDSLTPDIANDGKALFGRDSIDNYVLFSLFQLGCDGKDLITDDLNNEKYRLAFKKIWDNYYIPFIKGWFSHTGRFRSDDLKMGKILASTGSSAGVHYYPTKVTYDNDVSYEIEIGVMADPLFENANGEFAIQQGAGLCLLKSDGKKQRASAEFLKWLSKSDVLTDLAVNAGYITAIKKDLEPENLKYVLERNKIKESHVVESAKLTANLMLSRKTFVPKPFKHSLKLRYLLRDCFTTTMEKDRATVKERLKSGIPYNKAIQEFISADCFNKWYDQLCKKIYELKNVK